MFGEPIRDRRSERREATRREIVEAAWALAREHGLAGLSLRDLAKRVGMQAPSLYSYFPSKAAIYDAMFAEGNRAFLERVRSIPVDAPPRERLVAGARVYVDFCVEDPVRYQLLFQRTIPGFEPSPEGYADAVEALELARGRLADVGLTAPEALDLWTALLAGITSQQLANDPGGDRWARLVPDAVDMYLNHFEETR